MSILERHNVTRMGENGRTIVFAHGLGIDQQVWRLVAPTFAKTHRVVLFDHAGSGKSDISAYDPKSYDSLARYAEDVLEICRAVDKGKVIFVGHSVSAMIGVNALMQDPDAFSLMVMIAPSPCYENLPAYPGGMDRALIDGTLQVLRDNQPAFAKQMAQLQIGPDNSPKLIEEMEKRFASDDPTALRQFAKITLNVDDRDKLEEVRVPTCILQMQNDAISPKAVCEFVHDKIAGSTHVQLPVTGHCPQLVAPSITIDAIRDYVNARN